MTCIRRLQAIKEGLVMSYLTTKLIVVDGTEHVFPM